MSRRSKTDALLSERIFLLHVAARDALIDAFCPDEHIAKAKQNSQNRDCLVRVYLGRRINTPPKSHEWTGLRIFEADLSILSELVAPDATDYTYLMGVALACIHFDATHDARGVEFVLGVGPANFDVTAAEMEVLELVIYLEPTGDFKRRAVRLWLLDFNQCRSIDMSLTSMDRAVRACLDNHPYYPRAVPADHEDRGVWTAFRDAYPVKREELDHRDLASYFCDKVAAECARRAATTPKLPPKAIWPT